VTKALWQVHEIESRPPSENAWITAVHVSPNYGRKHVLLGDECWCGPSMKRFDTGNFLFVHNEDN
jgi:hypothetical protein